MKPLLNNIKKHGAAILRDSHENKSSSATRLIDAFFNFNMNGCKSTELHLKACYLNWRRSKTKKS